MKSVFRHHKIYLVIAILLLSFISYENNAISKPSILNSKVIGEGTVVFFTPSGTREIHNHSGIILRNPIWLIPPKDKILWTYLEPYSTIKLFMGKHVHIEGSHIKIAGRKLSNTSATNPYDLIMVDTIYCIE
ncbi:MAG: hypothetical protein WC209_00260 [Ignavibacteriaceae bacterium]|jgi:hypothetical protein